MHILHVTWFSCENIRILHVKTKILVPFRYEFLGILKYFNLKLHMVNIMYVYVCMCMCTLELTIDTLDIQV